MRGAPLVRPHLLRKEKYMLREGEDITNENNTEQPADTELSNNDNISANEDANACTPVYTEAGEYTCAEYLVTLPDTQTVEIEKTEEQLEYDETVLTTLQEMKTNQETLLQSNDETIALELYHSMDDKLNDIYNYVSIIVGLYFVGWIISTFNTWRRSNK